MLNLFKKDKIEFNKNVSFDVAYKALRKGYLIKHANYSDVYLKYFNGRIFELLDREDSSCNEITEFSVFEMLMDRWQILPKDAIKYEGNNNGL